MLVANTGTLGALYTKPSFGANTLLNAISQTKVTKEVKVTTEVVTAFLRTAFFLQKFLFILTPRGQVSLH